jgi:dTMP kinase
MLITVEGIDGSGKGTQANLLLQRIRGCSSGVELIQFPQYQRTFFGREIGLYLNGEFGDLMSVKPKLGALLYAGDRFEMRSHLARLLDEGVVVLCDRYTPSNQAHHAAKLPRHEWDEFFNWVDTLEHDVFGVPRPDLVIFLDVDAELSAELIKKKGERTYTTLEADLHEMNMPYQSAVAEAYRQLSSRENWVRIECVHDGIVGSEQEIASRVWKHVQTMLSAT